MWKRPGSGHHRRCDSPDGQLHSMKKPPKRKAQQVKPTLPQITTSTSHRTPRQLPTAGRKAPPAGQETKLTFLSVWKDFWSFVGPILTVVGLLNYYWPSISISTGARLDPKQDFQTQFVVTNTGNVPIHDVYFACALVGGSMTVGELLMDEANLAPIATLIPGEPSSRGCFSKSLDINGPMLRVTAYYRWPLIGMVASKRTYFSARRGADGVFLVPEAAPSPEPTAIIGVGGPPNQ